MKQAGIGRTAAIRVEPDGQFRPWLRFVAAGERGAAAFRCGNELHGGGGKAAADPDAEQLARQGLAGRGVARPLDQPGQGLAEAEVAWQQRRRIGPLGGGGPRARDADNHSGGLQPTRPPGLQRPVAVNGICRVHLLRRRHHADQQVGGVVGGRRWRARTAGAGRQQAVGDHQGDPHPQIAARLAEDIGKALAEGISSQGIAHARKVGLRSGDRQMFFSK